MKNGYFRFGNTRDPCNFCFDIDQPNNHIKIINLKDTNSFYINFRKIENYYFIFGTRAWGRIMNPMLCTESKEELEIILLVLREFINSEIILTSNEILKFMSLFPKEIGYGKLAYEFTNELQLEQYLQIQCFYNGWKCEKMDPRKLGIGIPDRKLTNPKGEEFLIELKTPKGHITDEQLKKHQLLRNKGCFVEVIRSVKDIDNLLNINQPIIS